MEPRIIELPPLVLAPNNFYLYYTEDGDITSLTNEKLSEGNYIQVSEKFVIDFLESKKDIKNFKVKISDQVSLEQKQNSIKNNYDFLIIGYSEESKLTITINNTSLNFQLNDFETTFVVKDTRTYSFAIVNQKNLNFVKKVVNFTLKDLVNGVGLDYAFDLKNELLVTKKEFDSYGIINGKKRN